MRNQKSYFNNTLVIIFLKKDFYYIKMNKPEKIPIKVRRHVCWCDSCFCGCKHEAINLLTNEPFKISGSALLNTKYEVTWSYDQPTYASYIK